MIAVVPACRVFVGRARERDFLIEVLGAASAGDANLATVCGAAGLGKSRLNAAVVAALRERGLRVAHVECREYERAPFACADDLLVALGLPTIAQRQQGGGDERFAAIAAELAALAAGEPLVLIVDDAHWCDLASLDLLDALAGRLRGTRARLLLAYRPDALERSAERARRIERLERRTAWHVELEPLAADAVESMIEAMLRDAQTTLPRAAVNEIVELAGGFPLYVEELVRGTLVHQRPGVPLDLRASVQERLDALDPHVRALLVAAAAIGLRFGTETLARIIGESERTVLTAVRAARDAGLVKESGHDFAFSHALVREIVYASVLGRELRDLHRRIAHDAIASGRAQREPAAAAEHFHRAGDAGDSVRWNVAAGEAAAEIDAHVDAARFFARAYGDAAGAAQRAQLAVRVAEAWYAEADLSTAAQWLERAGDEHLRSGERDAAAQAALRRARVLQESGRADAALAVVDEIVSATAPESALSREAAVMGGAILAAQDRPKDALLRLEPLGALESPVEVWEVRACGIRGAALGKLGRWRDARAALARAASGARLLGDDDVLVRILNNVGTLEVEFDAGAARAAFDEALAVATRRRNRRLVGWLSSNAAYAAYVAGDLAAARDLLERAGGSRHGVHAASCFSAALAQRIATLTGAANVPGFDEALLRDGLESEEPSLLASCAGALALERIARRADDEARALVERASARLFHLEGSFWLANAVARTGTPRTRAAVRLLLLDAAGEGGNAAEAYVGLFDAIVATRERRSADAVTAARGAAARFERCGWAIARADALVTAGEIPAALALYERAGAAAEVTRLTQLAGPRRRGDASLTPREREIAGFLREGKSTREIAEVLVISERTVESHVASIYRRFDVSTRSELIAKLRTATDG